MHDALTEEVLCSGGPSVFARQSSSVSLSAKADSQSGGCNFVRLDIGTNEHDTVGVEISKYKAKAVRSDITIHFIDFTTS